MIIRGFHLELRAFPIQLSYARDQSYLYLSNSSYLVLHKVIGKYGVFPPSHGVSE